VIDQTLPHRFVNHGHQVLNIASKHGWLPGVKYTNTRNIKGLTSISFLDIDWKAYNFKKHLSAVARFKPMFTVAQDITDIKSLNLIIDQAHLLAEHSDNVIIVPKDIRLSGIMNEIIPNKFIFGYSVPTRYGGTEINPLHFKRPVHLLGGRPDVQRRLANLMQVISFDCNRFTLDAKFGDFFNGEKFIPHPTGGYETCITDSIVNINSLWKGYNHKENH
jgi:hypothetical protein